MVDLTLQDGDEHDFKFVEEYETTLKPTFDPEVLEKLSSGSLLGYRLTPATLAYRMTLGGWIPARHLAYMSVIVTTAIAKGGARVIICMPPRHGKSEFCSVNTPIWHLEKYPQNFVMSTSYSADLSTDFARRVRDTILDEPPDLQVRLMPGSRKVNEFHTTEGGGMFSAGIGGTISGRGAHLFLLDDYHKNAKESLSETIREGIWDWFKSTAYTRLEPNASIFIISTRWNMDDLAGRLIAEQPDRWQVINLPAIAVSNDPLGREPGEALWPQRYSLDALQDIKDALGTYWWSAIYQQRPMPSMSNLSLGDQIRTLKSDEIPHNARLRLVRAWDLAASEEKGDWTAGPLVARDSTTGVFYILDLPHFRKGPGETQKRIKAVAQSDGAAVPIWIEQEPGSAGKNVIHTYRSDVLKGFSVKGSPASGNVEVRCTPLLAAVERGQVFMLLASWNQKLRDEINQFPLGKHDDQVVALALAVQKLEKGTMQSVIWGEHAIHNLEMRNNQITSDRVVTGATW